MQLKKKNLSHTFTRKYSSVPFLKASRFLCRDFLALCNLLSTQIHLPFPVPLLIPFMPGIFSPLLSWPLNSKSWRSFFVRCTLFLLFLDSAQFIWHQILPYLSYTGSESFLYTVQADNTLGLSWIFLSTPSFTPLKGRDLSNGWLEEAWMRNPRLSNSLLPLGSGAALWEDEFFSDLLAKFEFPPLGPQRSLPLTVCTYFWGSVSVQQINPTLHPGLS